MELTDNVTAVESQYLDLKKKNPLFLNGEKVIPGAFDESRMCLVKLLPPPRALESPTKGNISDMNFSKLDQSLLLSKSSISNFSDEERQEIQEGLTAAIELVEPKPWYVSKQEAYANEHFIANDHKSAIAVVTSLAKDNLLTNVPLNSENELGLFSPHDKTSKHKLHAIHAVPLRVTRMIGAHESDQRNVKEIHKEIDERQIPFFDQADRSRKKKVPPNLVYIPKDPKHIGQRPRKLEKIAISDREKGLKLSASKSMDDILLHGTLLLKQTKQSKPDSTYTSVQWKESRPATSQVPFRTKKALHSNPERDLSPLLKSSSIQVISRPPSTK